jgi:hydrogenase nickel incorporation protein HypA/HybF
MHELSIADNIVDIIRQNVDKERLSSVRSVFLKVGTFSGVVPDSLEFAYQAITASTDLEQSLLVIENIPFVIHCAECKKDSTGEEGISICSLCGSIDTAIISGKELQIKEIELDDNNQERA